MTAAGSAAVAGGRPAKVSVAILSWNGRHHLETCLEALAGQDDPGVAWEVVVLDNGSSDGTAGWLRTVWLDRRHPRVRLIESPVNLGFCAGNNRLVDEVDADAVVLLNNDTRPARGWLRALVEALAAAPQDVAAVSGLIVDWEGERLDFARGVMTFDGHAFQENFRRPLDEVDLPAFGSELPFACGGNLIVRRRSFLAAGGFDADYFAYLEDVDLGWRLWAGGERVTFAPEARVHHRSSATSDLLGLFNRGFLFERNAFLTAYKNYDEPMWRRMMPAVLLTLTARTQALLVGGNPGGEALALDPYAGLIADTAPRTVSSPPPRAAADPDPPTGDRLLEGLRERVRRHGVRGALRRGLRRSVDRLLGAGAEPAEADPAVARLTDERTVAQLRALSYVVGHLDRAAVKRAAAQRRRRRPDREIFERFPLHVVPTYPGDEELFATAGFRSWLPEDVGLLTWRRLDELMSMD